MAVAPSGEATNDTKGNGADMPLARKPSEPMEPIRRAADLDEFFGKWVAVKDGRIVAVADTSRGLAYELKKLGSAAKGAVMRYVAPPSTSALVGLG
jgi:Family of unknown function (DUF5678)